MALGTVVLWLVLLVLWLVLMALQHEVDALGYQRQRGSYSGAPKITVPAAAASQCAVDCNIAASISCGGFTFYDTGTCGLYNATGKCDRLTLAQPGGGVVPTPPP